MLVPITPSHKPAPATVGTQRLVGDINEPVGTGPQAESAPDGHLFDHRPRVTFLRPVFGGDEGGYGSDLVGTGKRLDRRETLSTRTPYLPAGLTPSSRLDKEFDPSFFCPCWSPRRSGELEIG